MKFYFVPLLVTLCLPFNGWSDHHCIAPDGAPEEVSIAVLRGEPSPTLGILGCASMFAPAENPQSIADFGELSRFAETSSAMIRGNRARAADRLVAQVAQGAWR